MENRSVLVTVQADNGGNSVACEEDEVGNEERHNFSENYPRLMMGGLWSVLKARYEKEEDRKLSRFLSFDFPQTSSRSAE